MNVNANVQLGHVGIVEYSKISGSESFTRWLVARVLGQAQAVIFGFGSPPPLCATSSNNFDYDK